MKKVDTLSTTGDYYYEKDHLGSVIRIRSSTGGIIDEYSYTVFGKAYRKNTNGIYKPVSGSNDSQIGNTRLFTGREYDREVSLYYMRARYYDAHLGRFVSRDPIGMSDDVNLYRYVANNPMKYVDRFGLEKVLIVTILGKESWNLGGEIENYYERNGGLIDMLKALETIDSEKYITKAYKSDHLGYTVDFATQYIRSQQGKYDKLIIVGHSLGGDNAVNLTNQLSYYNINVDLLITLDIKSFYENDTIHSNVAMAINYHQTNDSNPGQGENIEAALFNNRTVIENILLNELNGNSIHHKSIDDELSPYLVNLINNQ